MPPARLDGDGTEDDPGPRSARDWAVDVLCVVVSLLIGAFTLVVSPIDDPFTPIWTISVVIGVLASLSLLARRELAVTLTLVLGVLSSVFMTAGGATVIALFTTAVHRRAKPVVLLTALAIASTLLQYKTQSPGDDSIAAYWIAVIIDSLLVVLAVGWGMAVRARRQLVLSLAERARRAETEQELRVGQARMRERERIAREMHDALAHRLSLLSMHAGALEFRPDLPAEELGRVAGVIRATAHQSLVDLREVIYLLRETDGGGDLPLTRVTLDDLTTLVEETRQTGTTVLFQARVEAAEETPASLCGNVYRVMQEGLTNARKHAPAATVHVELSGGPESGLTLELRNPLLAGPQAAKVPGAGYGLAGLTERVTLAGGRLEHGRTVSDDYRVRVWLPWPSE
ncbi:sensor histidine kinase [Kutzneria sp. NPDC052558]|uniref:sensor histidine kinase n=1 Tax=Kutzneria sp. NPDC052558 TaxID=3364121 RepID=UPI0037C8D764